MSWYCYWSPEKEAKWQIALAGERNHIASGGKAEFITVLNLDRDLSEPLPDSSAVKYAGDFYVDFDSDDLAETTARFQEFLNLLTETHGVDLNCCRLYASGKKGYHAEIPAKVFIETPKSVGYAHLPAIYHEMAMYLYIDTMDLKVYTGGKGRMWRIANFRRPDTGTYKVRISAAEAHAMTPEAYRQLVAGPRPVPLESPPVYAPSLALLWTRACDKTETLRKRQVKRTEDAAAVARYGGRIPQSLTALMDGEGIREGTGFNKIAQQLGVVARVFRLPEDEFLTRCQGLVARHVGDGSRYATAFARRRELLHQMHYMRENPGYTYSASAIRALLDHPAADLGGVSPASPESGEEEDEESITLGMSLDRNGIYRDFKGKRTALSHVGFTDTQLLMDLKTRDCFGYDLEVYLKGEPRGRRHLTLGHLSSRSRFQGFISTIASATCQITDAQVNALLGILQQMTETGGNGVVYATHHEGLDIVTLPDGQRDIIWVEEQGVLSRLGKSYTFVNGPYGNRDHPYHSDLLSAPSIPPIQGGRRDEREYLSAEDTAQLQRDLAALLTMNEDEALAKCLGWTIACFLCPALRLKHNKQFPLLHLYGLAESGKSTTMRVLSKFHGHTKFPGLLIGGQVTVPGFIGTSTGTSSLPQILDEYKPSELSNTMQDFLTMMLRSVFDAGETRRGRITRELADTRVVTPSFAQTAPTAFLSEHLGCDPAILQRSITVPLTPQGNTARGSASKYLTVEGRPSLFGSVGRALVERLIYSDDASPEAIHSWVRGYEEKLSEVIQGAFTDRSLYGIAVAATGLHFLEMGLRPYFGSLYTERLETLKSALLAPKTARGKKSTLVVRIETNVVKVLATFSEMSADRTGADDYRLVPGTDYAPVDGGIEIDAHRCYLKYRLVMKRVGERLPFPSTASFIAALDQYPGARVAAIPSVEGMRNVYRLDARQMYETDGINPFAL
jgi:hypothetical protein